MKLSQLIVRVCLYCVLLNVAYSQADENGPLPLKYSVLDIKIEEIANAHAFNPKQISDSLFELENNYANIAEDDLAYYLAYQCYLLNSLSAQVKLKSVRSRISGLLAKHQSNRSVLAASALCEAYSQQFNDNLVEYRSNLEIAYNHVVRARSVVLRYWISLAFGGLAQSNSRHHDAIEASHVALQIAIENADGYREAATRGLLAVSEAELEFLGDALDNNQKAIDFYQQAYGESSALNLLMNRGYMLISVNRLTEAREIYQQAVQIAMGEGWLRQVNSMRTNLAAIALKQKDYERVIQICDQIYAFTQNNPDALLQAHADSISSVAFGNLGQIEVAKARFKLAVEYFERVNQLDALVDTLEGWSMFTASVGLFEEAYKTELKIKKLQLKIFDKQRDAKISQLKETFKSLEKDREIFALSATTKMQQDELEKSSLKSRNWWLTAMLFLVSSLLMILMYQKLKTRNLQLERTNLKLDRQRYRDPLTKCFNRRYLDERLGKRIGDVLTKGDVEIGFFLLDIDHFKVINDTYGHSSGDAVLVEFVNRMKSTIRNRDKIVRMGGEEFLIVMEAGDSEAFFPIALKLLTAISSIPFDSALGALEVTVSIGLSVANQSNYPDISVIQQIELSDQALYRAKGSGRNRAVFAQLATEFEGDATVQSLIDAKFVKWQQIPNPHDSTQV